jgi:hypothetical protein
MRIALAVGAALFGACVHAAQCTASSGPNTTALVELYSSEGCSRCAPAERWLDSLSVGSDVPGRVVPLALYHARHDSFKRQRKLTPLQRLALVYTPQVLLQGSEFRGWGTSAFDEAVARINASPARARLTLDITSAGTDVLAVRAIAEVLDSTQVHSAALYLASYDNRLHRIHQWEGPIRFAGPRLQAERTLALLPGALAAQSGVVAFVQNRRTAGVLQALLLATCP